MLTKGGKWRGAGYVKETKFSDRQMLQNLFRAIWAVNKWDQKFKIPNSDPFLLSVLIEFGDSERDPSYDCHLIAKYMQPILSRLLFLDSF